MVWLFVLVLCLLSGGSVSVWLGVVVCLLFGGVVLFYCFVGGLVVCVGMLVFVFGVVFGL